jgi:hypothetical protein
MMQVRSHPVTHKWWFGVLYYRRYGFNRGSVRRRYFILDLTLMLPVLIAYPFLLYKIMIKQVLSDVLALPLILYHR